jgi:subfamily B ATP-binding cassette protein HlyB/CyaB
MSSLSLVGSPWPEGLPKPDEKSAALHSGWMPVLARVPLFQSLSKRHLRRVWRLAEARHYRKGTTVVAAGGRGDSFHVILDGKATVDVPGGGRKDLKEGDFFGELALLDGAPRAATVTASTSLFTARIKRADFLKMVKAEPDIGLGLARGLVAMIREMGSTAPAATWWRSPASDMRAAPPSLLAGVPLFAGLSQRQLRKVARLMEAMRYTDGSTVVRIGSPGTAFHVIVDGRARAVTADGHEYPLETGESFGELALLDGAPRAATVTALGDLGTLCVARGDFLKLLKEEPTIAVGLVRSLVALIRKIEQQQST